MDASERRPLPNGVPKRADPTRTMVAPSSMATSKSCDIPIESSRSWSAGVPSASSVSRKSRSRRNHGRTCSRSSAYGGRSMRPSTLTPGNSRARASSGPQLRLGESGLGRLVGQVDLDEDRQVHSGGHGRAGQPFDEIDAVYRLNAGERARNLVGLVGLEGADQVPPEWQVGGVGPLAQALPGRGSRRNRPGRLRRRHGRRRRRRSC